MNADTGPFFTWITPQLRIVYHSLGSLSLLSTGNEGSVREKNLEPEEIVAIETFYTNCTRLCSIFQHDVGSSLIKKSVTSDFWKNNKEIKVISMAGELLCSLLNQ